MTRAVMEGVGYAFKDCLRVLNAAGTDFESALAVGGGARSALWLKIAASILNRPLEIPHGGETGAAFGAAPAGPRRRHRRRPDRDLHQTRYRGGR